MATTSVGPGNAGAQCWISLCWLAYCSQKTAGRFSAWPQPNWIHRKPECEAQGEYTRLPALAADLASRRVAAIVAIGGIAPAKAAKNATAELPIVFSSGGDPVKAGLITSLNRPGGNVTGVSIIFSELTPKLLDFLRKLAPDTPLVGALVNPKYPEAKLQITELRGAAGAANQPIVIEGADTERAIDKAFDRFVAQKVSTILVANDPFFGTHRDQLIMLVTKQMLPAIYFIRDFVEDGGVMSYGPSIVESYRQCGIYAGKILHGARPGDLPVLEPDKLELLINLKAAKARPSSPCDRLAAELRNVCGCVAAPSLIWPSMTHREFTDAFSPVSPAVGQRCPISR